MTTRTLQIVLNVTMPESMSDERAHKLLDDILDAGHSALYHSTFDDAELSELENFNPEQASEQ